MRHRTTRSSGVSKRQRDATAWSGEGFAARSVQASGPLPVGTAAEFQFTFLSSATGGSHTGIQTLPGLTHTGGSPTRRD